MLKTKNLDDRTFEDRISEAITQIPLYTSDWTNFNPSDPGITVLENLTAFQSLQLAQLNQISDEVRYGLLKLCGFTSGKGRMARLLLRGEGLTEEVILPANKQLRLGDLCFETDRITRVYPYSVRSVYGYHEDSYHEYAYLTIEDVEISAAVLGEEPKAGNAVYFLMDGIPEAGEELLMYLKVSNRYNRNAFLEKGNNMFATLEWQLYTEEGFVTLHAKDMSACFLIDGEVRLRMPEAKAAIFKETEEQGYCIRAVLKESRYDIAPKLHLVTGFLFEAYQKETLSGSMTYQSPGNVKIFSDLIDNSYVRVFGKEQKGSSYRMYYPVMSGESRGRYYLMNQEGRGMYTISFDRKTYGYEPEKLKNSVKVLVYSEEMMRKYAIGQIRGYDNEEFRLPVRNIVYNTFSIMTKRMGEDGEYIYDFVRPERYEEEALTYHLYEKDGRIVIEDAGDYIGAELYVATVAVSEGSRGNIRAYNHFVTEDGIFVNPAEGQGGCYREGITEIHNRFHEDVNRPYTAVTESDYEKLVKEIPELCINKVKAYADVAQNLVHVAVMPGTDEKFPMLSELYKKVIADYLDDRRILTTRINIVQPVYVPINVYGTVYIKRHFSNCREQIEKVIRTQLDYTKNDKNFGDLVRFDEIFHAIEKLDCVELIYDLEIRPVGAVNAARMKDSDIQLNPNVLAYPGEIQLDIGAYQMD